jgi:MOSC domain-containing protein YiiM
MGSAHVTGIYLAPEKGLPMECKQMVRAIAGCGLEGDRYAVQRGSWRPKDAEIHEPKRNVTLIAQEGIDAANGGRVESECFSAADTRRNIVIRGMELNALIGKEFTIGTVRLRAFEYATPCQRPSKLSGKRGFATAFCGNGGILCEILADGIIAVGDELRAIA